MKNLSKIAGWTLMLFFAGLLVTQIAMAMLGGKTPQSASAQEAYNATGYAHCVSHSALGGAKLNDCFDGFIQCSDEDVLRWKAAFEQNCKSWMDFQ